MGTENATLMRDAQESLSGKWSLAIITLLVYGIIMSVSPCSYKIYYSFSLELIPLIIGGPFALGLSIFTLAISRNQDARFSQLFYGFYLIWKAIGANLAIILFTILWTLLLVIPGIIAAISYSLTFYIIADDYSIGALDAIDKSKKMMYGYKWKYFRLSLRLLGLALLCIFTLGIGFFWLVPYSCVVMAKFYEDVNAIYMENEKQDIKYAR